MEQIENLMKVDESSREDLMLKDFINKRAGLLNELVRTLSQQCLKSCSEHADPSKVDFTLMET